MNYIDIDKNSIPYSFEMSLDNKTYEFTIKYNAANDFFTIDLSKDNQVIIFGEKLVYGKPLFTSLQHLDIPHNIIPYDTTGEANTITFENLNEDVFLFVVGDDDVD